MSYKIDKKISAITEDELYDYMFNVEGLDRSSFTDFVFQKKYMEIHHKKRKTWKTVATTDGHEVVRYLVELYNSFSNVYDLEKFFFPETINRAVNRVITSTIKQTPYYSENGEEHLPTFNLSDIAEAYVSLPSEFMDKDVLLSFFSEVTLKDKSKRPLGDEYGVVGASIVSKLSEKYGEKLRPTEVVTILPYISAHARAMSEDILSIADENLLDDVNTMLYEMRRGDKIPAQQVKDLLCRVREVDSNARRNMISSSVTTINMYRNFLSHLETTPAIATVCQELDSAFQLITSPEFETHAKRNDKMAQNIVNAINGRYSLIEVEQMDQQYSRHEALKGYISAKKSQTQEPPQSPSQAETLAKHRGSNNREGM